MMNMDTTLSSVGVNLSGRVKNDQMGRTFNGPFGHHNSISGTQRNIASSGLGAFNDNNDSRRDSFPVQHLNGSFLQFDANSKRLVDMSRQVLSSPRKHIIGENVPVHNYNSSGKVPWANANSK